MNSFFNLNTVLNLLSDIQGKSLDLKEFKSRLQKLVFSGMSFNNILKSAESILKEDISTSNKEYRNIILKGKQFNIEICDLCGNIFKENEKKTLVFFNCGHKYHYDCTIFVNGKISCKICKDNEILKEDTTYREEEVIKMADEEEKENLNRINSIKKNPSSNIINNRIDKERLKKFKLINEVNKRYYENTRMFE